MVELIIKKRDGKELSKEEISYIVNGFVKGEIPDYQVSALLMAIFFQGINNEETAALTDVMMRSGELIDLSEIEGIKVDKHSTGGVGDKTTLVLAPLVAAAGVPVAKMSGRGLGHTGGTLDKMEAIKGLKVDMTKEQFIDKVKKHGIAICSQNEKLVPADKKIYALRDVTGTVENISLISSSVMSKKLACGADAIVIDIKVGDGAFMKTVADAEKLARIMIETAKSMDRELIAVISGMDEPLGYAIGNALEVKEAIATLQGKGPDDLTNLCLELGGHMLVLGKKAASLEEGMEILKALIANGKAFEKFKELVISQEGDIKMVENCDLMPSTKYTQSYLSKREGYIQYLSALDIGIASVNLGAGRETKESSIDYGAGIILYKKIGDYVKIGEPLAMMYSNDEKLFAKAQKYLDLAFNFEQQKSEKKPLIFKTIK
ncbi:MAG: pyrimidine-nucleoside phosphorylase [Chitinophagaceae bacterium]|nr:pyrimidine-nucleoside phosphorylase [Chitinophagaceae bacterium]